ncbi:ornithine racemase Orr [Thermoanaerobacter brockii subsp. lactiethylicus]|jgi:predicted amino acid racemase|uniref:Alanine racemase domain protein n=2 Tax=Thermoanaerobacter TaxID=1754 RepID=B0K988_THEP3|nr:MULTISPECIES: ornithine racemase Orr [Thermoanaerobacter]ABY94701.1 alanine racemase domain protein [Thermoanaerobacter pseudethanolicus ATCC 33223]ADV79649.1 alanine racemase domain protein [Thermoanaerobacter brockii subsp. finnii Ako-1]MBZ4656056.1 alanine racemase domain protein [Thermoanaerobacter sp.]MDI3500511.1 ornithine racemase [Thermoanaerobacter sp.]HBW58679.1 alanine/ornithine racemase family PLP-dependent enzyme [Thermoanaerobacter sp.]
MYPLLRINLVKLRENTQTIVNLCEKKNIKVVGVTKVFCAIPEVAQTMVKGGVEILGDSRIKNLKKLQHIPVPKMLLRIPMKSEVEEVIKYADISLNSEIDTIKSLSEEAKKQRKIHEIILMVDLGDLREGVLKEDVIPIVEQIVKLEGIRLRGIGTNLTCYGSVIPTPDILEELVEIKNSINKKFNLNLDIVSGGNSSSLYLVQNGLIPREITQLRIGEAIVLGRETAFGDRIPHTYDDVFTLEAQIVELKEKPSYPRGILGMDAFGERQVYVDRGIMKRAILAIGRQDVNMNDLIPIDSSIELIGSSSDHLIVNVTNSTYPYKVGDIIKFKLRYGGILSCSTSEYVEKVIEEA